MLLNFYLENLEPLLLRLIKKSVVMEFPE